jgi:inhibitor of the pro-sigma K processing machinery
MVIYFANLGLQRAGIMAAVTLNSASLLTSAILGFPGLLLLYGIKIYKLL